MNPIPLLPSVRAHALGSLVKVLVSAASLAVSAVAQTAEDDALIDAALFPTHRVVLNGRLFFAADNGATGVELWVSDGTFAGTSLLKDINPGAAASQPDYLTVVGNRIFFSADQGHGAELWVTDGTSAGTVQIKDLNGNAASNPRFLTAAGNLCYFAATEAATGMEPWVSDGTAAGTRLVADVWPGPSSSAPVYFTPVNGTVFFSAESVLTTGSGKKKQTSPLGVELWKTNGTAAGTVLVKDIAPGSNHSLPTNLFAFNGALYFSAHAPNAGNELMRSDGTAAGTILVKDLVAGSLSSDPREFRVHANQLYFAARGAASGVWRSDGTAAGTVATTLFPGVVGQQFTDFVTLGSRLVGRAETGGGLQLWSTDGATSQLLFTLNPPDGFPEAFLGTLQLGNRLLFTAVTHQSGIDLYTTDGTPAGTVLVKDFQPGTHSVPEPLFLGVVTGGALLTAADNASGHELRVTDGSPAGTVLVKDLQPD